MARLYEVELSSKVQPTYAPAQDEKMLARPSISKTDADAAPRVLVVAPEPFYEDRGTPIAVRHVLEALSQLGHSIDVLTFPVGGSPEIPGVRYFRIANPLRIRAVPIGFSFRKIWLDLFLFFALRKRLREHDYLYIHAVEEAAFIAVLTARKYKIPVIYDMQCRLAEQMASYRFFGSRPAKAILNRCEHWLARNADHIVSSAGLAERVRKSTPEARIREWRYPNPISEVALEEVDRLRKALGITLDRPVIVYTGTFEAYQGLSNLIDAIPTVLSRVPHAVFVFVGADRSNGTKVKRKLASRLPSHAYRILKRQPREMISRFLAMADVVVSPRIHGLNLPLKILDYLAAGRAIVATSIAAHHTVLNEELAVLVEPTSPALAAAIIGLLEDPERLAQFQAAARHYAEKHLGWLAFVRSVGALYEEVCIGARGYSLGTVSTTTGQDAAGRRRVSVIIPARNEVRLIGRVVRAVLTQRSAGVDIEVIVVDDGSTDGTGFVARAAGARVVSMDPQRVGNPAAARNRGAGEASGDPIIFLDADCVPADGWLEAILAAHAAGAVCVGGSLALPAGLSISARADYYCGWYHVHPARSAGFVPNHPPCNLSVRRAAFAGTGGFREQQPIAYAHEELAWQAELQRAGEKIYFEPGAVAYHWNRPGFANLLRRNYRWADSAIESKAETGVARMAWLYRFPRLLIATSFVLAPVQALYIVGCWLRAGIVEPLVTFPVVLAARFAYAAGMMAGGLRWLRGRRAITPVEDSRGI